MRGREGGREGEGGEEGKQEGSKGRDLLVEPEESVPKPSKWPASKFLQFILQFRLQK